MTDYASYGLDTVKRTHEEGYAGASYCPWCSDSNVDKGFSMCFSNWCICPSCVWVARSDSKRTNKKFWKQHDCWKCSKKDVLCFISPTDGIQLGICVDCLQWAHDVLSKPSNSQKQTMPTLAESLLKCKVEGCVVYLPPISEGPLENYQEVRKALLNAGATYKRNTFVFPNEAQLYIDRLVSGESVNIKKEFQFFATPADIAQMMISYLPPVADDAKVLEPSAGDGALIKAFHAAYPNIKVDAFELMDINRKKLESMNNVVVQGDDFLLHCIVDNYYDIIIANPPFTKNQDIDHINWMYKALKAGGTLITIASPSWTFGSQKKQVEFKEWLEKMDVFPKTLPQKSFASSGTNITPVLLQIQKPARPWVDNKAIAKEIIEDLGPAVSDPQHRKPNEILEDLKSINKEIDKGVEQLQEMISEKPERKCRVCGCTENDCRQCIEKTGEPCYWVDEDLCSACVNESKSIGEQITEENNEYLANEEKMNEGIEPTVDVDLKGRPVEDNLSSSVPDAYQDYLNKRNSSSITFTEMKFFEQLRNAAQGVDITFSIKEKNGKYTVMVLPKASDQSKIQPLIVTGTPEELDQDFFKKVGPVLLESTTQLINAEEHKKSVSEAAKSNSSSKSSQEKKPEPKGPAAAAAKKNANRKVEKKGAAKKQFAKKSSAKKEETKTEETPKVVEQALF